MVLYSQNICEGRKQRSQNRTLRARTRTNNELIPHITPSLGFTPRKDWWGANNLTKTKDYYIAPML